MKYTRAWLGAVLLALLIAIALATSLYITPLTISDTDPSTYSIMPILMLPLFALFFAKRTITPDVKKLDLLCGVLLFLVLLVATAYLRVTLSYLFLSYRVDLLLLPLLISAFILMLFGASNLRRFAPLLVYALFASPLLLLPVIGANAAFASLNTWAVYGVLGMFVHGIAYSPPITLLANGYRIGIGESCVGVGILLAVLLLLVPVAYLYDGSLKRKILWVASGVVLLAVLNFLRMSVIAALWILYGPTSALSLLHVFAGILLFYLAIIVMILVAGLYRIGISPAKRTERKKVRYSNSTIGVALAVLMAVLYLLLTLDYGTALYVSPYLLLSAPVQSGAVLLQAGRALLNNTSFSPVPLYGPGPGIAFALSNASITAQSPIVMYLTYSAYNATPAFFSGSAANASLAFLGSSGLSARVYSVESNGTDFIVYHERFPYLSANYSYSIVDLYAVVPNSAVAGLGCVSNYNAFYSETFDLLQPLLYNATLTHSISTGYCVISRAI